VPGKAAGGGGKAWKMLEKIGNILGKSGDKTSSIRGTS